MDIAAQWLDVVYPMAEPEALAALVGFPDDGKTTTAQHRSGTEFV